MRNEEKENWIGTDLSNVENALEEKKQKKKLWLQKQPKMFKRKKIVPKRRKWETESSREPWRDTEKTKERWGREWNSLRAESRRSGGYTVGYLREKNDLLLKWKMEDMQLQKQRLEAKSKTEEQSRKQH